MPPDSIVVFCDMVSDASLKDAKVLTVTMVKLSEDYGLSVPRPPILTTFVFMNFVLAYGIWSDLNNEQLRWDLQDELRDSLLLKLSFDLCSEKSDGVVAAKATLLLDDFKVFLRDCMSRMQEMDRFDSGIARLYALEKIQGEHHIEDSVMDAIVPTLFPNDPEVSEVEILASQMIKEANK